MDERLLMVFVVAPFAASVTAGWFGWTQARAERLTAPALGWALAALLGGLFALGLAFLPEIAAGETYTLSIDWMPQIGLTFLLYLDGLGLLFVLLVTGIGAGIMAYAGYYLEPGRQPPNFLGLMLAFSGAMLGLVLAGNVITLFIAWELTSITSYLLIGFKGKDPEARRGANMAFFITASGGLALLVGLLMMGAAAGSNDLPAILSSGELLRAHPHYAAIAVLIMIGCFTKSAQFPFHFWLPNAMTAPTPASAFLHSATMVKAGVYLLARLYPILGDTPLWESGLLIVGLATMAVGAVLALRQRDLKGSLAYSTISQLGALVALIGLPNSEGLKAAFVGILAHALYKAAFFLIVGAVDHATGTRDLGRLGGLRRLMPGFAAAAGVAALSMMGAPPLLNFVGKEYLFDAYYHIGNYAALAVVWASAALGGTMGLIIFWDVFVGGAVKPEAWTAGAHHGDHHGGSGHGHGEHSGHGFHAPHPLMVLAPAALGAASILLGLGAGLLSPFASAAVGKSVSIYLIPPEITLVFWLSMAAIATAVGVFLLRQPVRRLLDVPLPSGAAAFRALIGSAETAGEDRSNSLLERAADMLLTTQGGKIRYYLVVIFLGVLAVLVLPPGVLFRIDMRLPSQEIDLSGTGLLKLVLLGLTLAATLASVLYPPHLLAVLLLGVAGYAIGGIFLLEPAPDVALVQFLVETLATVLLVIILARTPARERREVITLERKQTRLGMARDVIISVLIGGAVTVFALAATGSRPTPDPISAWHLENSYREVGATDVVAAIVTDFRAMDTLVEIVVFALASLGVLTMLTRPGRSKFTIRRQEGDLTQELEAVREGQPPSRDPDAAPLYYSEFANPVTRTAAALVTPTALLIAVGHILYGGVAPGDGFTAGVIGGLAVALMYIVFGYEAARRRLSWLRPAPLVGIGLLVALVNAALPLLAGRAFLGHTTLEGIDFAGIKFASSTVFEFAIFLTVFAGVSTIMEAIAHPKEVETL
jgi:NADH:ubiquinone oxidoreductase subunit 5 (subunit L)/multisubunit Na+/H+ antiporter MnhA subunit/multisubunit Na+/H+ antiporter MnhB subunit